MKKFLSILLALALCAGFVPAFVQTANAADAYGITHTCGLGDDTEWTEWDGSDAYTSSSESEGGVRELQMPAGHVILTEDIDFNDAFPYKCVTVYLQGDTVLCLNGHTIENSTGCVDLVSYFYEDNGEGEPTETAYNLTICDCGNDTGTFKGMIAPAGNSEVTIHSGNFVHEQPEHAPDWVEDGIIQHADSPAIYCCDESTLHILGGHFTGSMAIDNVPGFLHSVIGFQSNATTGYISGSPTFTALNSDNEVDTSDDAISVIGQINWQDDDDPSAPMAQVYVCNEAGTEWYSGAPITVLTDYTFVNHEDIETKTLIYGVKDAEQAALILPSDPDCFALEYNAVAGTMDVRATKYLVNFYAFTPEYDCLPGYDSMLVKQMYIDPKDEVDVDAVFAELGDAVVYEGEEALGWSLEGEIVSGVYTTVKPLTFFNLAWPEMTPSTPDIPSLPSSSNDAVDAVLNETTRTATGNIYGTYWAEDYAQTKHYVDVIWGNFQFTYYAVDSENWDPTKHTVEGVAAGDWRPFAEEDASITVVNHSNNEVCARLSVAANQDAIEGDLNATFTEKSTHFATVEGSDITLQNAMTVSAFYVDRETMSKEEIAAGSAAALANAPKATVLMDISGDPMVDPGTEEAVVIGTVTVRLSTMA